MSNAVLRYENEVKKLDSPDKIKVWLEMGDIYLLFAIRSTVAEKIANQELDEQEQLKVAELDANIKKLLTPELLKEMEWQQPDVKKWWGKD